jgi:cysteine desulfurase
VSAAAPTYLDHAATTPLRPETVAAMSDWLGPRFGNPSGVHGVARAARTAIDDARDAIADLLGGAAREVVFTGGGTEALNLAVIGTVSAQLRDGAPGRAGSRPVVITSAVEHDAVRNAAAFLDRIGTARHLVARVLPSGVLDLDALTEMLDTCERVGDHVAVVAVMAVNNEVGTVQPISDVVTRVRAGAPHAAVVVDAVQAAAWCDVASMCAGADLVAVTGHKFGGPQGVGALLVREGVSIDPIVHGGGQERERRSGTQNVAGIVGLAAGWRSAQAELYERVERVAPLRDRLMDGLLTQVPDSFETGDRGCKVAGNAHLCIDGVESEELLVLLDRAGIATSAGSACASGALHVSPVLLAMGVTPERANGALRLSLGHTSTADDVGHALDVIPPLVAQLRGAR